MPKNTAIWRQLSQKPNLSSGEVHIWRGSLDKSEHELKNLEMLLSDDELAKARRLLDPGKRRNFIAARGQLRVILGAYLDVRPSSLQFSYGSQGKPKLLGKCNEKGLCFNLSHSADLVLYAITLNRNIGIDLEKVQTDLNYKGLANRYFSTEENKKLLELPKNQQKQAFFCCWTRKEAYLKAKGAGLSFPLDKFEVAVSPNCPPALLNHQIEPGEVKNWQIEDISISPDYIAALAVEGQILSIHCYQIDHPRLIWPK